MRESLGSRELCVCRHRITPKAFAKSNSVARQLGNYHRLPPVTAMLGLPQIVYFCTPNARYFLPVLKGARRADHNTAMCSGLQSKMARVFICPVERHANRATSRDSDIPGRGHSPRDSQPIHVDVKEPSCAHYGARNRQYLQTPPVHSVATIPA